MRDRFGYVERSYRTEPMPGRWVASRAALETTDLYLLADRDTAAQALEAAREARALVAGHARAVPAFATSLAPLALPVSPLPELLRAMYAAGQAAGVGPMAAVAGAIAAFVGDRLAGCREVVVENGGDVYLRLASETVVGVFAGGSPWSGRLGLRVQPAETPLGVCTSSATVGPSLSFGRADAATVVAPDAALADAVATALANRIREPGDLEPALDWACAVPGVLGAAAVLADRLAVKGKLELVDVTGASRKSQVANRES